MIWTKEASIESSGGVDAVQGITETANSLNVSGLTASGTMSLMQENDQKNSQFLTAGQVFGLGEGRLGMEVRDEVIRRNEARKCQERKASCEI
jgi:hypothetical protein